MSLFGRLLSALYASLFFFTTTSPLYEETRYIEEALGCFEDPCIIKHNPGGDLRLFLLATDNVIMGDRRMIIIDGYCVSACTVAADKLRDNGKVCITTNAILGFHKGIDTGTMKTFIPPYAPDVDTMIREAGGYPDPAGINNFFYKDIKKLWPTCTAAQ